MQGLAENYMLQYCKSHGLQEGTLHLSHSFNSACTYQVMFATFRAT